MALICLVSLPVFRPFLASHHCLNLVKMELFSFCPSTSSSWPEPSSCDGITSPICKSHCRRRIERRPQTGTDVLIADIKTITPIPGRSQQCPSPTPLEVLLLSARQQITKIKRTFLCGCGWGDVELEQWAVGTKVSKVLLRVSCHSVGVKISCPFVSLSLCVCV